jgi:hypothetical protein
MSKAAVRAGTRGMSEVQGRAEAPPHIAIEPLLNRRRSGSRE